MVCLFDDPQLGPTQWRCLIQEASVLDGNLPVQGPMDDQDPLEGIRDGAAGSDLLDIDL